MTTAADTTFPGDRSISSALKDVEVERIVGPDKGDFIKLGSLWEEQPVVLHFLRRFGCRLCRHGALQMSRAIPHLLKAGVRVVAIGPEPLGLDEFVAGSYWAGEIYVDDGKKAYRALQLKSLTYFQLFHQLFFHSAVKRSLEESKNVPGNLSGDGMQLGATIVLVKGGDLVMAMQQQTPADHPSPEELLKLFSLDPVLLSKDQHANGVPHIPGCREEQCG